MYWLIPVGIIAGVGWLLSDDNNDSSKENLTILERNFIRLKSKLDNEEKDKILILGQPGAGKSSLLWLLTDKGCEPQPVIGQKTDATDWNNEIKSNFFHKYNEKVYVDSPGYDTRKHPVVSYLEYFPFNQFQLILFVINGKIHDSDIEIMKKLKYDESIKIVRSHSENLTMKEKKEIETDIIKKFEINDKKIDIIFFSGKTMDGLTKLKRYH